MKSATLSKQLQDSYQQRMNLVLKHIEHHLDERLSIELLSQVAAVR